MKEFANEVYLDFSKPAIAAKQRAAIDAVRARFGKEYPNIINGKKVRSERKTISRNPAHPDEIIGIFQKSGKDDAEKAMKEDCSGETACQGAVYRSLHHAQASSRDQCVDDQRGRKELPRGRRRYL